MGISHQQTADRNGTPVSVGTVVRVVSVSDNLLKQVPEQEAVDLKSMVGTALSVYEVDSSGFAWVEKIWGIGEENSYSHALALAPSEMEVLASGSSDA
jgi:hypothetical protein